MTALVQYDDEEDVEWVYDMDLEDGEEACVESEAKENSTYEIISVFKPICQDTF